MAKALMDGTILNANRPTNRPGVIRKASIVPNAALVMINA